VEIDQVSQFINQVFVWPENQIELDEVAERVARLIEVPCVLLLPSQGELKNEVFAGVKIAVAMNFNEVEKDGFVQFVRSYLRTLSLDYYRIRRVQLSSADSTGAGSALVHHLTLIKFGELNSQAPSQGSKDYGVLVLGTLKPVGPKEEAALLSVSQRLSELARVRELGAELKMRNQFLSIASHELKTPLTSIYGILQLQERMLRAKKEEVPFPDQERYHGFLKMVIRQVERLNELIDGLLDVSRIQNGRFMVEPSETDVAAVLQECIQSRLNVISQEAGVSLSIDSVPHLLAWVDPVRIEEVITNLVINAIRFSPEGGVVWIKLAQENGAFRLAVRDQGLSISNEDRERIFQPFERSKRPSRMGGLGLGLFIAREIAQLHGGNVSLIETVPGKGNIFEAHFPIRSPH
jgi:signal transduction histidine kinase